MKNNMLGGEGNDLMIGGGVKNVMDGGQGSDTMVGGGANNLMTGGSGNDVIIGGGVNNRLDGGADNDVMIGAGMNNTMTGGSGDDVIIGMGVGVKGMVDHAMGRSGLNMGSGDVPGLGGAVGNAVNSTFEGGTGDDLILGVGVGTTMAGGWGDDIIIVCGTMNTATGNEGSDYLCAGGWGMVDLFMTDAAGEIQTDLQSAFNAMGAGSFGFTGSDVMQAMGIASGGTTLSGGWGDDFLMSGFGDDVLRGNEGSDTFIFHLGEGQDLIQDSSGSNVIELRASGMFDDITLDASNIQAARTADGDLILNFMSGGASYGQVTIDDFANSSFTMKMVDGGTTINVDLYALYDAAPTFGTAPVEATDISTRLDDFASLLESNLDVAQFDMVHAPGATGVSTETYTTASDPTVNPDAPTTGG
jgi:Ca2+-binding RTX toxin-like protein